MPAGCVDWRGELLYKLSVGVTVICERPHPGVHAQRVNAFVLVGMDQMCFNVPRLPHETHAVPARVVQKVPNHLRLSRILVFGGRHDVGRGWGGVGWVG